MPLGNLFGGSGRNLQPIPGSSSFAQRNPEMAGWWNANTRQLSRLPGETKHAWEERVRMAWRNYARHNDLGLQTGKPRGWKYRNGRPDAPVHPNKLNQHRQQAYRDRKAHNQVRSKRGTGGSGASKSLMSAVAGALGGLIGK